MIYTCTLNPAIDLFVALDKLEQQKVNRTYDEEYQANGKGINVSIVLKKLGVNSTALGLIAGFTGEFIKDELKKMGIQTDFIEIDGITRVNIFINTVDGEYKIVNRGPNVSKRIVNEMKIKIMALPENSTLFVSGSLPRGIDDFIYVDIAKIAKEKNIDLILDISSKRLLDCLPYEPYLIKPNEEELANFFDMDKRLNEEEVIELGYELFRKGAKRVLVSLGAKGAIYIDQDHLLKVNSAKGKVVNTACAGDAMLAMFFQKVHSGFPVEEALAYASAAGASTAFAKVLSDLTDVEDLKSQIKVTNLKGRRMV